MSSPQGSFIWYELLTADSDAAKAFYDPIMGWDIEPRPAGEMDYRMIRTGSGNGGGVMRISEEMRGQGARPMWLGYIAVEAVDATVAQAQAAGATVLMPAFDLPGVGRMALIADPQGAAFYVMRGQSEESSNAFSPLTNGHAAWNELATNDLDAAKRFYPPLFNWKLGDAMPMGPMGDYQFFEQNGEVLGAMFTPPNLEPMWRFCFRVADLEASMEATKQGGGKVTFGPTEIPGGDRIFQALDPEGAHFMCVSN